ncbi:MAG: permease-like cell division protein FtsX [Oscillospiraceae bacterium]
MRGSSFGYLIKEGARSVFKNRLMSFASIGVLTCCLILIGSAFLLSLNITNIVGYAESQNEVVVFLEDDLSDNAVSKVEKKLSDYDNISDVKFVSRDEALEETKDELGEASELLEGIDGSENPLPDSFVIKIDNIDLLNETVSDVENMAGVIQVNAPKDVAKTLVQIRHITIAAGIAIIGILGVVSVMIIANTIKLSVFSRRKEINIMKFVGATDRFIKLPFVIEGIIIGVISSIMSFLALWGGYSYLVYWVSQNPNSLLFSAQNSLVNFKEIALFIGTTFVCSGTLIGGFGSMIFARKHLKV